MGEPTHRSCSGHTRLNVLPSVGSLNGLNINLASSPGSSRVQSRILSEAGNWEEACEKGMLTLWKFSQHTRGPRGQPLAEVNLYCHVTARGYHAHPRHWTCQLKFEDVCLGFLFFWVSPQNILNLSMEVSRVNAFSFLVPELLSNVLSSRNWKCSCFKMSMTRMNIYFQFSKNISLPIDNLYFCFGSWLNQGTNANPFV